MFKFAEKWYNANSNKEAKMANRLGESDIKPRKWLKKVVEKNTISNGLEAREVDNVLRGVRSAPRKRLEDEGNFEGLFLKCVDNRRDVFANIMRRGGMNKRIDEYVLNVRECVYLSGVVKIYGEFYLGKNGNFEPIEYKTLADSIYRSLMYLGIGATEAAKVPLLSLRSMDDYSAKVNRSVIRFSNCFYDYDKGIRRVLPSTGVCMYSVRWVYKKGNLGKKFFTFLERVLPNVEDRMTIQEFFSMVYIDRSKISIEKFLIMVGGGANGKSVLLNIISAVVGEKYISHLDPNQLRDYKQIVEMSGKKLNIAPDVRSSAMMSSAMKALVSGESVQAWEMYRGAKDIIAPPLVFSMNSLPKTEDNSNGMVRRMLPVFFGVTIPEEEQDKALAGSIIKDDLPAVFDWLMEGRRRLLSNKGEFTRSNRSHTLGGEILKYSVPIIDLLSKSGFSRDEAFVGQEAERMRAKDIIEMYSLDNATTTVANQLRSAGFRSKTINGHQYFLLYKH